METLGPTMPTSTDAGAAEAVQDQQQRDAEELFERLEQITVGDLTINYTLQKSSVVVPRRGSGLDL